MSRIQVSPGAVSGPSGSRFVARASSVIPRARAISASTRFGTCSDHPEDRAVCAWMAIDRASSYRPSTSRSRSRAAAETTSGRALTARPHASSMEARITSGYPRGALPRTAAHPNRRR